MIDPMVLILAPAAAAFGWVVYDLRRQDVARPEPAMAEREAVAPVRVPEPAEAPARSLAA